MTRGYVGYVEAPPGKLLLGGVKIHKSAQFECRACATRWGQLVETTNLEAGRAVSNQNTMGVVVGNKLIPCVCPMDRREHYETCDRCRECAMAEDPDDLTSS